MEKEIKFRAWDSTQKIMFYLFRMCKPKDSGTLAFECRDIYHEEWEQATWEDLTVMQFTGLKDSEGVEIYEGDILSHPEFRTNVQVVWLETGCWGLSGWDVVRTRVTPGKIIGNIYQNPELLNPI